MPLMRMAMLGSKPMRMGASTVEPNIAITCWTPMAAVCGQGRRSSGAITPPCCSTAAGLSVQSNIAIPRSPLVKASDARSNVGALQGKAASLRGSVQFVGASEHGDLRQHRRVLQDAAMAESLRRQQARAL